MGAGIRIQDPGVEQLLWQYDQRLTNLELNGDDREIYVGTIGVDGVDALITPDSPPFLSGWTNVLGVESPVSFRRTLNGWVHLRGAFYGGGDGTVIFVLPPGFRPAYRTRCVIGTAAANHYATFYIEPTGEVIFGTVV